VWPHATFDNHTEISDTALVPSTLKAYRATIEHTPTREAATALTVRRRTLAYLELSCELPADPIRRFQYGEEIKTNASDGLASDASALGWCSVCPPDQRNTGLTRGLLVDDRVVVSTRVPQKRSPGTNRPKLRRRQYTATALRGHCPKCS
jgi:hypothetical protein